MPKIENHLILPFGRSACDSHRIRVTGSSTQEMQVESEGPCLHIDRSKCAAVTLDQFSTAFPAWRELLLNTDPLNSPDIICEILRTDCELQSSSEHLFLTLYFDQLNEILRFQARGTNDRSIVSALMRRSLMPLPQTHLYLTDFSALASGDCRQRCVKVDFAFWTGQRFVAVLADEPGHCEDREQEERLLRFWGLEIFHFRIEDNAHAGDLIKILPRLCHVSNRRDCG